MTVPVALGSVDSTCHFFTKGRCTLAEKLHPYALVTESQNY